MTSTGKWRVLTSITYWPKWRALKAIIGEITTLNDHDRAWLVAMLRDLFSDYDKHKFKFSEPDAPTPAKGSRKVGGPK